MPEDTSPWTVVQGIAAIVTAVIALWLLAQGQRDRRRLREERRTSQASRLLVIPKSEWHEGPNGSRPLGRSYVDLLNGSDHAVTVTSMTAVQPSTWESLQDSRRSRLRTAPIALPWTILAPQERQHVPLPHGWPVDSLPGSPFVIVEFADASGARWRRRSDTLVLMDAQPRAFEINRAQKVVQRLSLRKPFSWIFHRWPVALAMRSARRHPQRFPLSVRFLEATFGYWGGGTEDGWLRPKGAPPLWGYQDLEDLAGLIPRQSPQP